MPILVLGFVVSLVLTALVAMAVLARTGLRGRATLCLGGFGLGLLAGTIELALARRLLPLDLLLDGLPHALWLELGLQALFAGFSYVAVAALVLRGGLHGLRRRARRRGDVVTFAAGLGSGLALSATALRLGLAGVWPPSALFVAVVYPLVQLCFVLLLAAAVLALREGATGRTLLWQLAAALLQTGYQFVLRANETIGHWLAWLAPDHIGWLWLGLIALAWALGFAVMVGLGRAEPLAPHSPEADPRRLLDARLWFWLGMLILVPTGVLLLVGLAADLPLLTARIMVLALAATPVMAAAIMLRTAFSLSAAARQPQPALRPATRR